MRLYLAEVYLQIISEKRKTALPDRAEEGANSSEGDSQRSLSHSGLGDARD